MKKLLIILLVFVGISDAFSQSFYNRRINRNWVATGGLGYARSLGDLTNPGSYFDTKLNIEAGLQYRFTDRLNLRTNLLMFQMSGDDQDIDPALDTRVRGLSYVSNNMELSATLSVSLFPMTSRFTQRKRINPYVFAGIGALYFNPKAVVPDSVNLPGTGLVAVPDAGKNVSLAKYDTERPNDYSRIALVIPIGAGVRVKVTEFIDISAEVSNRITFTDYLDDISGRSYPDASLFDFNKSEDITAFALSNPNSLPTPGTRGNPENDDFYLIFNVKADFYIQGDFLNKVFGIGGKKFNIKPRRRGGIFSKRR